MGKGGVKQKEISTLQYITQGKSKDEILNEVKNFLTGGGDWVQLRMKGASYYEFLDVAKKVKELCWAYQATFIINDSLDVAVEVKADGVHLGKGDMPTSAVRELVGKNMIIGRTANTARDIEILCKQDINYIGLGPYKHTTTKENIAPILGLEGYQEIFERLDDLGVACFPVVAIGSVDIEDIEPLSKIDGVYGVAVSGSIAKSDNPTKKTAALLEAIEKYMWSRA